MSTQNDFEFQRFKTEMGASVIKQLVSLDIGILLLNRLVTFRCGEKASYWMYRVVCHSSWESTSRYPAKLSSVQGQWGFCERCMTLLFFSSISGSCSFCYFWLHGTRHIWHSKRSKVLLHNASRFSCYILYFVLSVVLNGSGLSRWRAYHRNSEKCSPIYTQTGILYPILQFCFV